MSLKSIVTTALLASSLVGCASSKYHFQVPSEKRLAEEDTFHKDNFLAKVDYENNRIFVVDWPPGARIEVDGKKVSFYDQEGKYHSTHIGSGKHACITFSESEDGKFNLRINN